MSEKVIRLYRDNWKKSIVMQLVTQCAPVLSGLKTSNMLVTDAGNEKKIRALLKGSMVSVFAIFRTGEKVVLLLFREDLLQDYLGQKEIREYLFAHGYHRTDVMNVLKGFAGHYLEYINYDRNGFPHEMGIILGYPLCDVRGFVENKGKNYLASGYWKVYGNREETEALFSRFDKVREEMSEMILEGCGMRAILVAFGALDDSLQSEKAV